MSYYENWLIAEKKWIDEYCGKIRRRSLFVVAPLVLVGFAVLFGALGFVSENSVSGALEGAAAGLMLGVIIDAVYLLIMLPALRPGRYAKKIDKNVRSLNLTDAEKEQLGREMLEADEKHKISYQMIGPKSKETPARFVLTPHFAFLEGSSPYSILVRLSDITEIRPAQERKDTVEYHAKSKTYYKFTLYTIGFFRRDRAERGLADSPYPDVAMGFFQKETRDRVLALLSESNVPVRPEE